MVSKLALKSLRSKISESSSKNQCVSFDKQAI